VVTGKVKLYQGRPEIIHPEITWGISADLSEGEGNKDFGRIIPVYTELEGVASRTLRKVLWEALEKYGKTIQEDLPAYLLERRKLPVIADAIRAIHFPPEDSEANLSILADFGTPAHQRLIYGEFFKFEYLMLRKKLNLERAFAQSFGKAGGKAAMESLMKDLPFQLTGGQKQALEDILGDFAEPHPMNRLIQGDVGSGKTAVAFLSASVVLAEGGQAALMAPTEILAEQHFKSAFRLLKGKLNVGLLTGKTPQSERNRLLGRLQSGEPILLIGTHALIEEPVVFANLKYVMIDEQHRFGVEQRRTLRNKGMKKDASGKVMLPHTLILTATPIPRTLALTAFGDLSVTSIKELPPGRSAIKTQVVSERMQKMQAYQKIRTELQSGRQAYFIYPLVNESEAEGFTQLKSAVAEAENLASEVFPEFKVGLLHGQMKPEEKASVMEKFQKGELHILTSTTVVEVGVDVPNATVIAIEHAERFGLSQLHQLRGRVGRGQHQSYCYLFTHVKSGGTTSQRLEVLEETNDGFKIAEADLEIRGPGEFLGTRQAGGLPFRLANLVRDRELLLTARDDAMEIMKRDPELTQNEHLALRRYYEREGGVQFERLKTS
jgi:ATP-dependent DNA helicase RecG